MITRITKLFLLVPEAMFVLDSDVTGALYIDTSAANTSLPLCYEDVSDRLTYAAMPFIFFPTVTC